jgi:mono/diheme cytochrome c family protein
MNRFLLFASAFLLGSPLAAQDEGRLLFEQNCVACHGSAGRGDGPASRGMTPPPADLTKIAERRDGVWPMLEIMSILDGYFENTNQREGMPVFDSLLNSEMVEFDTGNGVTMLVPSKLINIVNYLETLQDPEPESYVP